MKSSVAIAMIVCGTVLIALPYIYSAVVMQQVADTMVALSKPVNLNTNMPEYAHSACMLCGVLMILVGAVAGLHFGRSD